MSIYAIHKMLCLLRNDASFQKRMTADPMGVLKEFPLTSQEKDALTRGDVRKLYEMGAHAYLLQVLSGHGLFGLNRENYLPRIRGQARPN